jgi:hypothetical protein
LYHLRDRDYDRIQTSEAVCNVGYNVLCVFLGHTVDSRLRGNDISVYTLITLKAQDLFRNSCVVRPSRE